MSNAARTIRQLLAKDAEQVPLESFLPLSSTVKEYGAPRLAALAAQLRSMPKDRGATQLFLQELFVRSRRQVGADICLFKTFVTRMSDIEPETLDALPDVARQALEALKERASKQPVPMPDALMFAHSLATEGHVCSYLREEPSKKPAKAETFEDALRAVGMQAHPDRGGDAKQMAVINRLRRAYRNEKQPA